MNTIDETTSRPLTRRTAVQKVLAIGVMGLAAASGNDVALAALTRRRRSGSGRRREDTRTRDRHERHARRPRLSARFDAATSSVIVNGSKFSENVSVNIKVDYDWPFLDYSVPWPIPTASALEYTNNHGRFTKSVPILPGGSPFTGRVEVVDSATGRRVTKNFNGI